MWGWLMGSGGGEDCSWETACLDGRVAVVTGANCGIGKCTALGLAQRGAEVILACRDEGRGLAAEKDINSQLASSRVKYMRLDLASIHSIKSFVEAFLALDKPLHILVNNAGVMGCPQKWRTEEGFEMHLGVNHLGHFLLTYLLLDLLKRSSPSRVVVVTSMGYKYANMEWSDLERKSNYNALQVYMQSKLANVLFVRQLAKRLDGTGVSVFAVDPGIVDTSLARHLSLTLSWVTRAVLVAYCWPFLKPPPEGARTSLYCALSAGLQDASGSVFSACKQDKLAASASDPADAERLWRTSLQMLNLPELSSEQ